MRVIIKKLFRECIDLRSYNVKKAIHNNESYIIFYERERMTLSPKDLIEKCRNKQLVESRIGSDSYELWSYKWNPDE